MLDLMVVGIACKMHDVGLIASYQIIDGNDAVTFREQTIGQVRSEKSRAPGYD